MPEIVSAFGLVGAALVTGIFSVLAQRMRSENRKDHATVAQCLEEISETLDDIDDSLDDITDWQEGHDKIHKGEE